MAGIDGRSESNGIQKFAVANRPKLIDINVSAATGC
jgi:hypothetical protein